MKTQGRPGAPVGGADGVAAAHGGGPAARRGRGAAAVPACAALAAASPLLRHLVPQLPHLR